MPSQSGYFYDKLDNLQLKEKMLKQVCDALIRYFATKASNISFPEYVCPIQAIIERWKKNVTNG